MTTQARPFSLFHAVVILILGAVVLADLSLGLLMLKSM